MKITDVETIWIGLPEVRLIADSTQQSLLVRIHTDEGIVGIGEAHTAPYIIKAIIESDSTGIVSQGIRSLLLGENPLEVERLWHKIYHYTSRHGRRGAVIHAISAVDMALWDILGKAAGLPGLHPPGGPVPGGSQGLCQRSHARHAGGSGGAGRENSLPGLLRRQVWLGDLGDGPCRRYPPG